MTARTSAGPTGWAVFAGVVLFIAGFLNFFYGLAAIVNDDVITVGGRGAIIWNLTAWGWIHLLLGIAMVLVSYGLFAAQEWGRAGGVIFATINAIAQIGLITAFPLWSILIIALDIIVIYQLTSRWLPEEPRRAAM
jgi:hypothetical protein